MSEILTPAAPLLTNFLEHAGYSAAQRSERECARHAFAVVEDALRRDATLDWTALEHSIHAHNVRWSRDTVRAVLVQLLHWWRPLTARPLPQLALLVAERPAPPPARVGDAADASTFEALWTRWEARLPGRLTAADPADAAAAVLVTALLRLDVDSIKALRALAGTPLVAMDMRQPAAPGSGHRLLEATTALHVMHMRDRHPEERTLDALAPDAVTGCAVLCAELLADGTSGQRAIRRVIALGQAWRRRHLPPFVLEATRPDASTPFDAASWNRFAHGLTSDRHGMPTAAVAAEGTTHLAAVHAERPDPMRAASALRALATRLQRKTATRMNRPEAADAIAAAREHTPWSPLAGLMLDWTHRQLKRSAAPVRPATAGRYLAALVPVVTAQAHVAVVTVAPDGTVGVDRSAWASMLERLALTLDDQMTIPVFARFHASMAAEHPAFDAVDLDVLEWLGAHAPRAHDIHPDAFEAAMAPLCAGQDPVAHRAALMAALAYYAGLRASEVRWLRCIDLVDDDTLLLCVRAHGERALKSDNARRDIPLRALLPACWAARLDVWVARQRAADDRRHSAFLFADPAAPQVAPPQAVLDVAVQALRRAVGDRHLVFHSLRHACATYAALRLVLHRWPALRAFPISAFAHPCFEAGAIDTWRTAWMPPALARRTDRDLHALAALLGHASPATTFQWYVHAVDVIDRALVGWLLPAAGRTLLASLGDAPGRAVRSRIEAGRERLGRLVASGVTLPSAWALLAARLPTADAGAGDGDRAPAASPSAQPGPAHVPALAAAVKRDWGDVDALARRFAVPARLLRAIAADLSRGRRFGLPRQHVEQTLFAAATANAARADPAANAPGWAAWRAADVVRTTRRAFSSTSAAISVLEAVAPVLQGLAAPAVVLVEVIRDGATPRALAHATDALRAAVAHLPVPSTVRACDARTTGWMRRPSPSKAGQPWLLVRVGHPGAHGAVTASRGLALALDAIALARTFDD